MRPSPCLTELSSPCALKITLKLGTVLGDFGPSVPSRTGMGILLSYLHGHQVKGTSAFHQARLDSVSQLDCW